MKTLLLLQLLIPAVVLSLLFWFWFLFTASPSYRKNTWSTWWAGPEREIDSLSYLGPCFNGELLFLWLCRFILLFSV